MNEQRLQHELIMFFSRYYPHHRGLLFEVNNDSYSRKYAMKHRAMGMVRGVSDLILISPFNAQIIGLEVKAPGSRHDRKQIESQFSWGKKIMNHGGLYFMSSDLELLKKVTTFIMKGESDDELVELCRQNTYNIGIKLDSSNKTIRF